LPRRFPGIAAGRPRWNREDFGFRCGLRAAPDLRVGHGSGVGRGTGFGSGGFAAGPSRFRGNGASGRARSVRASARTGRKGFARGRIGGFAAGSGQGVGHSRQARRVSARWVSEEAAFSDGVSEETGVRTVGRFVRAAESIASSEVCLWMGSAIVGGIACGSDCRVDAVLAPDLSRVRTGCAADGGKRRFD